MPSSYPTKPDRWPKKPLSGRRIGPIDPDKDIEVWASPWTRTAHRITPAHGPFFRERAECGLRILPGWQVVLPSVPVYRCRKCFRVPHIRSGGTARDYTGIIEKPTSLRQYLLWHEDPPLERYLQNGVYFTASIYPPPQMTHLSPPALTPSGPVSTATSASRKGRQKTSQESASPASA